ncbi:hypothetical protein BC828DRAFT_379268 [Blastocladiella britannica]|nr:hypothetical protein BC828DRAFT_379268 [Blastocladiella britannica]
MEFDDDLTGDMASRRCHLMLGHNHQGPGYEFPTLPIQQPLSHAMDAHTISTHDKEKRPGNKAHPDLAMKNKDPQLAAKDDRPYGEGAIDTKMAASKTLDVAPMAEAAHIDHANLHHSSDPARMPHLPSPTQRNGPGDWFFEESGAMEEVDLGPWEGRDPGAELGI